MRIVVQKRRPNAQWCLWVQRDHTGRRQPGGPYPIDDVDRVAATEVYMRWATRRGQQLLQYGMGVDRFSEKLLSGLGERDVLGEVGMKPVRALHDRCCPQRARCQCEVAVRPVGKLTPCCVARGEPSS